jgi:hypothetical protein
VIPSTPSFVRASSYLRATTSPTHCTILRGWNFDLFASIEMLSGCREGLGDTEQGY